VDGSRKLISGTRRGAVINDYVHKNRFCTISTLNFMRREDGYQPVLSLISHIYPPFIHSFIHQLICTSKKHPELKWIAGLYYYISDVQPTNVPGWRYKDKLRAFVEGGLDIEDNSFIDGVSSIVNRGGPFAGGVDGIQDRRDNFRTVLKGMGLVKQKLLSRSRGGI